MANIELIALYKKHGINFNDEKRKCPRFKIDNSLIATYCIENDYQFLHNDSDFDGYEEHLGWRVIRLTSELLFFPNKKRGL